MSYKMLGKSFKYKNVAIKIVLLLLTSMLLFLLIEYYEFSRHTIDQDVSREVSKYLLDLQKNNEKSLSLNKYLDESIETFYIIGPYLTSDIKHKIIGQRWYNYETFLDYLFSEILFSGEDFDEGYQQLVFIVKNRIISFARVKRSHGDFLSLEENKYKVNEEFRSIEERHQYFRIKKANE